MFGFRSQLGLSELLLLSSKPVERRIHLLCAWGGKKRGVVQKPSLVASDWAIARKRALGRRGTHSKTLGPQWVLNRWPYLGPMDHIWTQGPC